MGGIQIGSGLGGGLWVQNFLTYFLLRGVGKGDRSHTSLEDLRVGTGNRGNGELATWKRRWENAGFCGISDSVDPNEVPSLVWLSARDYLRGSVRYGELENMACLILIRSFLEWVSTIDWFTCFVPLG